MVPWTLFICCIMYAVHDATMQWNLAGIIQGLQSVGWSSVPLITMETEGADCLNKAVEAGSVVRLGEISSIAKSLGALSVSERLLELTKEHKVISKVVPDQVALKSCFR